MFKLRTQFFLALLTTSAVLTGALYAFFSFSFERGFWRYIEQKEIARAAPLIEKLEQHYQEHGNWDWFRNNPDAWPEYLTVFMVDNFRSRRPPPEAIPGTPPERMAPPVNVSRRVSALFRAVVLLDSEQQLVAGDPRMRRDIYRHKLQVNSRTVGYLGMPLNPALRDLHDAEFAGDQTTNLALIAVAAFLFALLSALPLSHFLTKRIHALVQHIQRLSQGQYDNKIHLKGEDELTTLAEHLNDLGHSLQQSEQARRRWVADISHELRTPLAVLQAEIEALEDGVRSLDQKALARLQQHTRRLTNLVDDLYDLSLTDIGALTYRKQPCDLHALLHELVTMMQPRFEVAGLTLSAHLPAGDAPVLGDPQRLHQLFLNLLQNSLNYTQAPGRVELHMQREANQFVITLDDSAPGVDASLHEKLFERLYRAESSRNRATGGAGLGLTLCRNIVEAHEGTIHITNSQLGGLTVTVTLPLSRA